MLWAGMFTDESRPRGGFIPAEILVLNSTAGYHGTTGGTHDHAKNKIAGGIIRFFELSFWDKTP